MTLQTNKWTDCGDFDSNHLQTITSSCLPGTRRLERNDNTREGHVDSDCFLRSHPHPSSIPLSLSLSSVPDRLMTSWQADQGRQSSSSRGTRQPTVEHGWSLFTYVHTTRPCLCTSSQPIPSMLLSDGISFPPWLVLSSRLVLCCCFCCCYSSRCTVLNMKKSSSAS